MKPNEHSKGDQPNFGMTHVLGLNQLSLQSAISATHLPSEANEIPRSRPAEWNNKAVGFVSYGAVGGARAAEHLRQVAGEL